MSLPSGHNGSMLASVTDEALIYVLSELAEAESPLELVTKLAEDYALATILWRIARERADSHSD